MSFINYPSPTPVFPVLPPLAWSVHKKPIFSSSPTIAASGRETTLARAVYPRWAFTLTYGGNSWLREQTQNIVIDSTLSGFTELESISGLFLQCLGPYGEFYYEDPDDNSRLGVGTAEFPAAWTGGPLTVPLYYPWGNGPFNPSFVAPVTGIKTIDAIYFNGVAQSPSVYTIDPTNTKLIITVPFTGAITVTTDFHFYFRCRFLDDHQDYSQFARNLWENKECRFESVKP